MANPQLSEKIRVRIAQDFPSQEHEAVESLLTQCLIEQDASERVQTAILDLAKGDKKKLAHYIKAARQDYRDVLYWAYYYENDPFRLLTELLQSLQSSQILTSQEVTEVQRAARGTRYRLCFERLCQIIEEKDKTILAEHYEMIRRIGKILKLPARLWKKVSGQVKAFPLEIGQETYPGDGKVNHLTIKRGRA